MSEAYNTFYGKELQENEIGIMFVNQYSGTLLRTPKNTIAFDITEIPGATRQYLKADVIVVSHEHYDHLDGVLVKRIFERGAKLVIAPPAVAKSINYLVPRDKLTIVEVNSIVEHNGLRFIVKPGDHPCKTPLTMIIQTDNDFTIYHVFDSKSFAEMEEIGKDYPVDIAIVPIGIAPGTSPEDALNMVKMIKPKAVIPHHATFGFEDFKRLVEREVPEVKVYVMKKNQPNFINKTDFES